MDTQNTKLEVVIPNDVAFSDLNLQHDPRSGGVVFEYRPIERICEASGIELELLSESDDERLGEFVMSWYTEHLAHGGQPDFVADSIMEEISLTEQAGQCFSYPAGHA